MVCLITIYALTRLTRPFCCLQSQLTRLGIYRECALDYAYIPGASEETGGAPKDLRWWSPTISGPS